LELTLDAIRRFVPEAPSIDARLDFRPIRLKPAENDPRA